VLGNLGQNFLETRDSSGAKGSAEM